MLSIRMATELPTGCTVVQGDIDALPAKVKAYVTEKAAICMPDHIHICNGSNEEYKSLVEQLIEVGLAVPLKKHDNW